jgi:hypothetical protein
MKSVTAASIVTAALLALVPSAAAAAITVNISQAGSDVVALVSGNLDLTGATFLSTGGADAYIWGGAGFIHTGPTYGDTYSLSAGGTPFGTGGGIFLASSTSGDKFALASGRFGNVSVPEGYISGSAISSSTTWSNQTLGSLGLTIGTYSYSVPNDKVTINIGSAVPEPATWAMMLVGFGCVGLAIRRREKVSARISFA